MRIDVEKFKTWLKAQIEYERIVMRRLAAKELYEETLALKIEQDVYEDLIDCIERPDYNDCEWVIEDD